MQGATRKKVGKSMFIINAGAPNGQMHESFIDKAELREQIDECLNAAE